MRFIISTIILLAAANASAAQEVSITSDGRQLEKIDGNLFEQLDDMYLQYEGIGPKSVQPV